MDDKEAERAEEIYVRVEALDKGDPEMGHNLVEETSVGSQE